MSSYNLTFCYKRNKITLVYKQDFQRQEVTNDMYIDKIYDENIGPIERINIDFPLNTDGLPKPIIFVGENGSGKSTLLSNIVDALYNIAAEVFDNAMQESDSGSGRQYYKAISPIEIRTGQKYLFSYILFENLPPIQYVFKSGKLSVAEFKEKVPNTATINFSWKTDENYKTVKAEKEAAEKMFEQDIVCYFGPDRYEKPMWMGSKYFDYDDSIHPSAKANWNGQLKNPISIKNVAETNLQWLMDVIVDSRPDVKFTPTEIKLDHIDAGTLRIMGTARQNLETILSRILGTDVYFALNLRNRGASRFKIVERSTDRVIAPTLNSLSTGQIALFNMFATIVRYADNNNINKSFALRDISGIVVIDEVELHLHTTLQKEVLPQLIKMFPKVQFIITSHAPLFLLGMQETFGEDGYEIYEMPTATKISVERFSEFQRAYEYFKTTQTYQRDAEIALEHAKATATSKVLVVTEGATDWMHMKTAMSVLKTKEEYTELFSNLTFNFLEYEPANSKEEAQYKLEMGNTTLTNICEHYAKLPNDTLYIFVADCDVPDTNKKMSIGGQQYKKWAKNVYSFTIPIPESRRETPGICIEHLYSDTEIKTEIMFEGISRRLYMGNEFDSRGIAVGIDRFCAKANSCGPDKINIIEGSHGDKITSLANPGEVDNYALSKMNFAKYVESNPDQFNFDNFADVFKVIKAIIADCESSLQPEYP